MTTHPERQDKGPEGPGSPSVSQEPGGHDEVSPAAPSHRHRHRHHCRRRRRRHHQPPGVQLIQGEVWEGVRQPAGGGVQVQDLSGISVLIHVVLAWVSEPRICKRLRSPGIDPKESIPPAYVAWQAGTSNRLVVPTRQAGNRFLGSLKGLQILVFGFGFRFSIYR